MVYKNLGINFFLSGLKMLIKVSMVALGMVNFYLTRKSRKNPVMMKLKYIVAMSLRLFQMTLQLFHLTLKLYRRRILVSYDMLHIVTTFRESLVLLDGATSYPDKKWNH